MLEPHGGGGPQTVKAIASGDGGLSALVAVVEGQLGIPVDHVVRVDVDGFRSLVDRVGGIDVRVDLPVRDTGSGLVLDEVGCVNLDGEQALALVRSRHVEVLDPSGRWIQDPLSDLGRVEIQRQVVRAALVTLADTAGSGGLPDPIELNRHVDWAVEHVAVDTDLGLGELREIAQAAAALDPAAVSSATLPVMPFPGNPNRLATDPERAPDTVAAFTSGQPLPASPTGVPLEPHARGLPGGAVVDPC